MVWVSSLLGEAASLWQQSKADFHRGGTDFGFASVNEMLTELEFAFQGTKPASQHIADFNMIIAPLKMTEESKILSLRHSINEDIKDVLARSLDSTKSDFTLFCRQVIAADNRLLERAYEYSGKHYTLAGGRTVRPYANHASTLPPPRPRFTASAPPTTTFPQPMQIDAVAPSKDREAIRQNRSDNRVCLYCGGAGHQLKNCPKRSAGLKVQGHRR
ncbi:hypothetical protein BCR37DRAFT_386432 [Protomyces lactucae-debilis]|uniref:CCHC-type domain-containing protein n=1 Tax=Protomyces lactucae-debilis TaxID=2754530 RepID=A0A1Y2FJT3_PROLT|nr:uncharacterized protein BCR37DRAFT_386432 [Protomyces lactucae-debilis]ORY84232.1 hypothetical protein BCR37DRAFT_386432 [Protomyces lactucae-debilis]